MKQRLLALGLALVLAGCGQQHAGGDGARSPSGAPPSQEPVSTVEATEPADEAQLWVTKDRGAEVLIDTSVPAGTTVLQAVDREAEVKTRYGGRFVQSIDGIDGSLARQQDWFYFVNGIEPNLGAADVRLRAGDVAWWDFRSWKETMQQPVVVGAFPEPFIHGFDRSPRPVEVRAPAELADAANALQAVLGPGDGTGEPNLFVLEVADGVAGAELRATRGGANDSPVRFVLAGSQDAVRAAAFALAKDPMIVRYRYTARFDGQGMVVG